LKKFDVYILIGKSRIKLLYSQNKKDLRCFDYNEKSYTPFYFYSDNTSSIIGENAKTKFFNGDQNAYGNYFELIKAKNSTFNFFGNEQNIKLIIVRAIEKLINEFLNEIIFSSKNVYELKDEINLKLVYYSDINENEINLVNDLFKKEGFSKIEAYNYNFLLLNYLDSNRKIGFFKGYIVSDSIDDNLHLSFHDVLTSNTYKTKDVGDNIATNPMIDIIANRLVGFAIEKTGFNLDVKKEKEIHKELFTEVVEKLKTKKEFYQPIKLSNGSTEKVKIKLSQINSTLMTQSHFTKDFGYIQQFHEKTGLQQSDVIFILHGDIHSNQYTDKIKSNYAHVYVSDEPSAEILRLFYTKENCAKSGDLAQVAETKNETLTPASTPVAKTNVKRPPIQPPKPSVPRPRPVTAKVLPRKTARRPPTPPPPPPKPSIVSKSAKPSKTKNNISNKVLSSPKISAPPALPKKKSIKQPTIGSPPPLPKNSVQKNKLENNKTGRRPLAPPPIPKIKKK